MKTFLIPFQKIHDGVEIFIDIRSNIKLLMYIWLHKGDSQPSRKMIEAKRPLTGKTKLKYRESKVLFLSKSF